MKARELGKEISNQSLLMLGKEEEEEAGQAVEVEQPQRPQRRRASTPQLRLVWFRRERMIAKLVATLRTWFRNRSQIVFQSHLLLLHIISQGKNTFHTKRLLLAICFFCASECKKCENDGNNLPSGIVVTLESNLLGKKEIIKAKTLKDR